MLSCAVGVPEPPGPLFGYGLAFTAIIIFIDI